MNHARPTRGQTGMHLIRIGIFFGLILLLLLAVYRLGKGSFRAAVSEEPPQERFYLPTSAAGEKPCALIHHRYYSLCYDEDKETARWVAYRLTASGLKARHVKRTDDYRPDRDVSTGSATPEDYRRSGYDRGHLLPAGDRTFSTEAMSETFLMSNISPQEHAFNGGIWRELEQNARRWAKQKGELYVVVGPLYDSSPKRIGKNGVAVPKAFFRVLLAPEDEEAIGFVIPNAVSEEPLTHYAMSVDSVETLTGLDFFADLLLKEVEEKVESNFSPEDWPINERTYRLRVEKWNKNR